MKYIHAGIEFHNQIPSQIFFTQAGLNIFGSYVEENMILFNGKISANLKRYKPFHAVPSLAALQSHYFNLPSVTEKRFAKTLLVPLYCYLNVYIIRVQKTDPFAF